MSKRDPKHAWYRAGYALARRRAATEIEELRRDRDELRAALSEWRSAVDQRREAEQAVMDFHRSVLDKTRGFSLH